MKDEKITAILSLYKSAVLSYSFENHYRDKKPLEQGFDRQQMTDTKSSLYEDVSGLFRELRTSQAQRYIAEWERIYIIDGWCADDDKVKYDSLQAIGKTFIGECKRIAAGACVPEEEFSQRGGGIDHQTKVQQINVQTEPLRLENLLPKELNTPEAVKVFERAIKDDLMEICDDGLKWKRSKALLAYFLGHFLVNGIFLDKEFSILFAESRLGKALSQLANNKNGNGKPRGYEKIDKLFEQP